MVRSWRTMKRLFLIGSILGLILFLALYVRSWFLLREFETYTPPMAATLFDRNGELIANLGRGQADYVPYTSIPKSMIDAIVAVEDKRFYHHFGLDPIRIMGAIVANIRAGGKAVQGASTITQQLAKNAFLNPEKTLQRKAEEAVLAIVLEQRYSKAKILELYLNTIYYGQGAIGIENAAQIYFDKRASELSLAESALLAGLPRAPSVYDPFSNPDLAVGRRDLVLDLMVEREYITAAEAKRAKDTPLELSARRGGKAPYFVDYIENLLVSRYGSQRVYQTGLRIHTTLDLRLQTIAQSVMREQKFPGAMVSLDPKTGQVLAMVGGRDYAESQFNRAVLALRQPGSAMKPFVYVTALRQGWRTNTLVLDAPQDFRGYKPQNWRDQYWGPVTLKHALADSLNTAAVWTLDQVGVTNVISLVQELGINTLVDSPNAPRNDRNLSLALGGLTKGVRPLQLAGAYIPFANGGTYSPPVSITRVVDSSGIVLEEWTHQPRQIFNEQIAFLMTDMMRGTLEYGTARYVNFDRPAAGKTGSTNDQSDAWFIGYTPSLLTAVYIGYDQPKPLGGFGGTIAGPIWADFMKQALADTPKEEFLPPPGVAADIPVHIFSGLRSDPTCKWVVPHAFITGTEPTEYYDCQAEGAAPEPSMEPTLD